MALRAVSIVNLEHNIRASFDRQVNEITRNMQVQHQAAQHPPSTPENSPVTSEQDSESMSVCVENYLDLENDTTDGGTIDNNEENPPPSPNTEHGVDTMSDTLDEEIGRLEGNEDRDISCCKFYRNHWLGHIVSGILSGFLFIVLGVIFIVNGENFPFYAGLALIILGMAPCCMAINRYRYTRLYERERRRAVRRLNALRRIHNRQRNRERYSDSPPAYDNLGFEISEGEFQIVIDQQSIRASSTRSSSFVLPTYDQFVKKEADVKATGRGDKIKDIWCIKNINARAWEDEREQAGSSSQDLEMEVVEDAGNSSNNIEDENNNHSILPMAGSSSVEEVPEAIHAQDEGISPGSQEEEDQNETDSNFSLDSDVDHQMQDTDASVSEIESTDENEDIREEHASQENEENTGSESRRGSRSSIANVQDMKFTEVSEV